MFSEECPGQTVSACNSSRWEAVNQSDTRRVLSDSETDDYATKRNKFKILAHETGLFVFCDEKYEDCNVIWESQSEPDSTVFPLLGESK